MKPAEILDLIFIAFYFISTIIYFPFIMVQLTPKNRKNSKDFLLFFIACMALLSTVFNTYYHNSISLACCFMWIIILYFQAVIKKD